MTHNRGQGTARQQPWTASGAGGGGGYATMAPAGGEEVVAAAPPSLLVDLESVSERLHVDPRVLARHLQPEHDTEAASGRDDVFPSLPLQVFSDLIDGKAAPLPGRRPIVMDQSPMAAPARVAQSHRMPPKTDRMRHEGWVWSAGAVAHTPPAGHHWKMQRWWETQRARPAHHVHGVIVRPRQNRRDDVVIPQDDSTPLMSASLRPLLATPGRYEFSHKGPKGVVNAAAAGVLPIRAVVVPIRGTDTTASLVKSERLLAVPMPDEQEPMAPSLAEGLLASTRMRGRMPDEVTEVEVRIEEGEAGTNDKVFLIIHFARPLIGWLSLAVGVFGQAMQGPVIRLINEKSGAHVNGFLLGAWNAQGLFFLFSLWSIIPCLNGDFGARERAYLCSLFGFALVATSGVISGLGSGAWTEAFALTSVPQGYLFNSFHPSLIIIWRLMLCRSVLLAEKLGIVVGLVGASLSMYDRDPNSDAANSNDFRLGDALAFCSSLSLCFYLLASKKVRPHLPLSVNLMVVTFFSALTQAVVGAMVVPGGFSLSSDPNRGVFGYTDPTRVKPWLLLNAVGCVAQAGYIGALKYLNPIVVSICMTCEPVMATWITYLILGESLSAQGVGIYTIVGGFAIIAGSLIVSYYSRHHKEGVEIDIQADTNPIDGVDGSDGESRKGKDRDWSEFALDGAKHPLTKVVSEPVEGKSPSPKPTDDCSDDYRGS